MVGRKVLLAVVPVVIFAGVAAYFLLNPLLTQRSMFSFTANAQKALAGASKATKANTEIGKVSNTNVFDDIKMSLSASVKNVTRENDTQTTTEEGELVTGDEITTEETMTGEDNETVTETNQTTTDNQTVTEENQTTAQTNQTITPNQTVTEEDETITEDNQTITDNQTTTQTTTDGEETTTQQKTTTGEEPSGDTTPQPTDAFPIQELGGCTSEEDCKNYCFDHVNECLDYAETHERMSVEEIQGIREFVKAVDAGETPGGCSTLNECEQYCDGGEHVDECIDFSVRMGFMTEEEAEIARKTGGLGPGGCQGPEECEQYCSNEEHVDECISFALENGLITQEEAELARKTGGKGPGGCTSEEECEQYCETHVVECAEFGLEQGLLTEEDVEMMRKTGGKGPGGCTSEEECDAYCETHPNECQQFALEHNITVGEGGEQLTDMQQCMLDCFQEKGLKISDCPEDDPEAQKEGCAECSETCRDRFSQVDCLSEEEIGQRISECESQGEGVEGKMINEPTGLGFNCTVRVECMASPGMENMTGNMTGDPSDLMTGEGNCLSQEEGEDLGKECQEMGKNPVPTIGDSGLGYECVISVECKEWEDNTTEDKTKDMTGDPSDLMTGEGNCLSKEEGDSLSQECQEMGKKGSPIMGDSGLGYECVVDMECATLEEPDNMTKEEPDNMTKEVPENMTEEESPENTTEEEPTEEDTNQTEEA